METFQIDHVVRSIDLSTGGPARSVTSLISGLLRGNLYNINLNTLNSKDPILDEFSSEKGKINFYANSFAGFSIGLNKSLNESKPDIFHGHGLWQIPVHQMARIAQKKCIPYIITPRGMLEPWSLKQSVLKKRLALKAFQNKDLINATCIHATSNLEAENIRKLGYSNPIAVIPNGIDLSHFPKHQKKQINQKKILFLSRIHHKKGIENLIEAWALIPTEIKKDWLIDIIGNGESEYIQKLKRLINQKGMADIIQIKPPLYGIDKLKAYQDANLFVLPTYSENFGIVIAEALACNTPVITTYGAPWKDLKSFNCGWWIDIGVEPLVKSLETALRKTPEELDKIGANGRKLIEENYSVPIVSSKMEQLYKWILNIGQKPKFILNETKFY